jgi:glycosyltransferase involved in cell wall biosynthesis
MSGEFHPQLLAIFLTGCAKFNDALFRDLLDESVLVRCSRQSKSSAEAATFALRLAFAEEIDFFAVVHPRHIYRADYFQVVDSIAGADSLANDSSPRCWNLIKQEWLPRNSDTPIGFHFKGGLGLSEDEVQAGQQVGAPDTFVLNRAAARIILTEAWNHSLYDQAAYDLVWRQTLLANQINISLAETTEPVFVYIEKEGQLGEKRESGQADLEQVVEATESTFPDGLRDPAKAATVRLKTPHPSLTPEVSIVIPTYNEGNWLFHTVDSLHAMETNHRLEIIVVDDGCSDGSVEKLSVFPDVRIVSTPHPQAGLIAAKNTGASQAKGEHLCFVDSHMLMPDRWLDLMLSALRASHVPTFVTCGITDVIHYGQDTPLVGDQYGYTLSDWTFNVRWHHYGRNRFTEPFPVPLCPGGMSLMRRDRFEFLGGFCNVLRKWGSEDVELALRHYCAGGQTICDPRTHVYHYFKNNKTRKPTFSITFAQTAFNAMIVAKTYFSAEDFQRVKAAFLKKAKLQQVIDEVQSGEYNRYVDSLRSLFVRGFSDWREEFSKEAKAFEASRPELIDQATSVGTG